MNDEEIAAETLTALIRDKVGAKDRTEVSCPRELSAMTPCVGRDGRLAVATNPDVCVGCGQRPTDLLAEFEGH